jgi:hypothetical protein
MCRTASGRRPSESGHPLRFTTAPNAVRSGKSHMVWGSKADRCRRNGPASPRSREGRARPSHRGDRVSYEQSSDVTFISFSSNDYELTRSAAGFHPRYGRRAGLVGPRRVLKQFGVGGDQRTRPSCVLQQKVSPLQRKLSRQDPLDVPSMPFAKSAGAPSGQPSGGFRRRPVVKVGLSPSETPRDAAPPRRRFDSKAIWSHAWRCGRPCPRSRSANVRRDRVGGFSGWPAAMTRTFRMSSQEPWLDPKGRRPIAWSNICGITERLPIVTH